MPDIAVEGFYLFLANIWVVPIGVLIGMFVGAMPGLTSSGTLAMLLPVLMVLPPEQGLILGTVTSVLFTFSCISLVCTFIV